MESGKKKQRAKVKMIDKATNTPNHENDGDGDENTKKVNNSKMNSHKTRIIKHKEIMRRQNALLRKKNGNKWRS